LEQIFFASERACGDCVLHGISRGAQFQRPVESWV